jgi:hypothetical protein
MQKHAWHAGGFSLFSAAGQPLWLPDKSKPARTETVRAGRVDRRGVDGGARADHNFQMLLRGKSSAKKWRRIDVFEFTIPDSQSGRTFIGRETHPAGSKPGSILSSERKKTLSA